MRTQGNLKSRIHAMCLMEGTTEKEMQKLGTSLLRLFRDACRENSLIANDLLEDICSDSFENEEYRKMTESMVRLEFFATETVRQRYEQEIESTLQTGWMIQLMEIITAKLYSFAEYGEEFVSILNLCYLSKFKYTEDEMLEELKLSRPNFYLKKKYAIILFALEFETYKRTCILRSNPYGYAGEQMTLNDFMV